MQLMLLWAWKCLASFEIDLSIKCTGALNPKKGSKQTANSLGIVSYGKKKPLFHGVDAPLSLSLSLCTDAYQFPHLQRHNFLGARKFGRNDFHDISLMHITDLSKQRRAKHVHHHKKSFIRSTSKTSHSRSPRQDCKEDEVLLLGYEREKIRSLPWRPAQSIGNSQTRRRTGKWECEGQRERPAQSRRLWHPDWWQHLSPKPRKESQTATHPTVMAVLSICKAPRASLSYPPPILPSLVLLLPHRSSLSSSSLPPLKP